VNPTACVSGKIGSFLQYRVRHVIPGKSKNFCAAVIALSTVKLHGHSQIVASSSIIFIVVSPLLRVDKIICIRRGDDGGVINGMMGMLSDTIVGGKYSLLQISSE
jgi:hypothetical protein